MLRSRWFRTFLLLAVALAAVVLAAVAALVAAPLQMQVALVELAAGLPLKTIEMESIYWQPDGRLRVEGVVIRPPQPQAPTVSLAWAEFDPPPAESFLQRRELALGAVELNALQIQAHHQQPPPAPKPSLRRPLVVTAETVTLSGASYQAPADEPMSAVSVQGISGTLAPLQWIPKQRRYTGAGAIHAARLEVGSIEVTDLDLPSLTFHGDHLEIEGGTVAYGDSQGVLNGTVYRLNDGPITHLKLSLSEARLEDLIQTATGEPSPLLGRLDVELDLLAGGPLERGHAQWQGSIRLRRGRLLLGEDIHWSRRALLDVAPWVDLDGSQIHLHRLQGQVCFGRGWVQLDSLRYRSKKEKELMAWGRLEGRDMAFSVRTPHNRSRRLFKGLKLGLSIKGSTRKPAVKVVKPEELSRPRAACGLPVEVFTTPPDAITAAAVED